MNAESLKEAVRRELPNLLREDPEFRAYVLELARQEFTPRSETVDRFDLSESQEVSISDAWPGLAQRGYNCPRSTLQQS